MRKQLIITGLILLTGWVNALGQTFTPQLYILKADHKTLTTDSNGVSLKQDDSDSDLVVFINPDWIDSMEIVKEKDETIKYGTRGQNGVVIIRLTKDGFNKMRPADKEKFSNDE